jgi:hypothetical protein
VKHGISCLSQDSYGAYIAASCMDNRYNRNQPHCLRLNMPFVKAAFDFISLSGSICTVLFIWIKAQLRLTLAAKLNLFLSRSVSEQAELISIFQTACLLVLR